MKKTLIYQIMALLAIGCSSKEEEGVSCDSPKEITRLTATVEEGLSTKTGYVVDEENSVAHFAWVDGEQIDVAVKIGTNSYTGVHFLAPAGGSAEVEFLDAQVDGEESVASIREKFPEAEMSPWAFYPSRSNTSAQEGGFGIEWDIRANFYDEDLAAYPGEEEIVTITMPQEMSPAKDNMLEALPLLGIRSTGTKYRFSPLAGVLAFTVNGLTSDLDILTLSSESAWLSGSFHVVRPSGEPAYVDQSSVVAGNHSVSIRFSGIEGTGRFYVPVPAGNIPAGFTVTIGKSGDEDSMMTIATKKTLTVKTGVITQTPAFTFTPKDQLWADYATATFIDDLLWAQHSAFSGTIPVTIQRSGLHPEKYRIANPYTAAASAFGYSTYTAGIEADEYMYFFIEDGALSFTSFLAGIEDKDSAGKPLKVNYRPANAANTYIVRTLTDGTPLELQFAAYYNDPSNASYYYTKDASDGGQKIHVVIDDDTPESWNSIGTCTFIDNYVWPYAGLSDPVERDIQQYSHDAGRFRIAKPYPAADADEWFEFNVGDPDAVTSVNHYTGVTVADETNTDVTWKAVVWNGAYGYDYSNVMSTQPNGLPLEVQIGPCYRDSEGVFTSTSNYDYEVGKDHDARVIDIIFPHVEETWTLLGTGTYFDEYLWKANSFAPYRVEVEVSRSDLDANRYRIENPYKKACTAFKYTATGTADDYMYIQVDPSTGTVTYGSVITGMGKGDFSGAESKNMAIADASEWGSGTASSVTLGTAADPQEISLWAAYFDSTDRSYYFASSTGTKYLRMPSYSVAESWTDYCEGTYTDGTYDANINGTSTLGTVAVTIQRSTADENRYRIANPYRGLDAEYLVSTYDSYLYFTIGTDGLVYFEPFRPGTKMNPTSYPSYELAIWHPVNSNLNGWSQGGSDFANSRVSEYTSDGTPKVVKLGAHYFDITVPTPGYCYTRHGSSWKDSAQLITISFNVSDKAVVTAYELPLKADFHNPVASIALPSGTLEKMVIKVTGVDRSKVSGLRLYQGGWMDSDYVPMDADGLVTMTAFTNATVSSAIDLNFWMSADAFGSAICFDVQEVVMDGISLPVVQDKDIAHLAGVVLNDGGDTVNVRGDSETVSSFRIPALVTTNAGTLIAAYDVRYASSADLQGDIDVGMKRSTDGGKTWSDLQLIMDMGEYGGLEQNQNGIGDPCLLVDENTGDIFCFAVWAHGHYGDADKRCLAWAGTGYDIEETTQFMMVKSSDDGLTWSAPVNITRQIKRPNWKMTFQGPGRGITMKDGTLVVPIQHQEGDLIMHGLTALHSGIMYSTDHGLTWHTHNLAHTVTSESTVAEIEPGVLLLSMRDETDSHYRREYVTRDLGRSWTEYAHNGKMWDSTTEASMIHVNAADNALGEDLLIFSSPQDCTGWRDHMTIQISKDKGLTWPYKLLIDSGASLGYSCLTMVDDSTVGILYECSRGNIVFQAIPLTAIIK